MLLSCASCVHHLVSQNSYGEPRVVGGRRGDRLGDDPEQAGGGEGGGARGGNQALKNLEVGLTIQHNWTENIGGAYEDHLGGASHRWMKKVARCRRKCNEEGRRACIGKSYPADPPLPNFLDFSFKSY